MVFQILSKKMWTALHVAVMVVIYCATATAEPQARTSSEAEPNDTGSKKLKLVDPPPPPSHPEAVNKIPIPPKLSDTGNGDEDNEQVSDNEDEERETRETKLSRPDSVVDIHLVESIPKGQRKRYLMAGGRLYPYVICYFFTAEYSNPVSRRSFKKVVEYIASRTCISFIDITLTLNASDPNSPTKLGCRANTYLNIRLGTSCVANVGMPSNEGPNNIYPCEEVTAMMHEVEHCLLLVHVHMGTIAITAFSILISNVNPGYQFAFAPVNVVGLTTDCTSNQRYPPGFLSETGDWTYQPMRSESCSGTEGLSTEDTAMAEINFIYKCNEYACGNRTVDCNEGYYAKENGVCQCICPKHLDRKTNCSTLVNGPVGPIVWPTKAVFLSGGYNVECPVGTKRDGTLSVCGHGAAVGNPGPTPFASSNSSRVTYLDVCTVTSALSDDLSDWPFGGDICIIKPKDIPCTGRFNLYKTSFSNYCPVSYNGTEADISVIGNMTYINYCCKRETTGFTVKLPDDKPFTVFSPNSCTKVEGMRFVQDFLGFTVGNVSFAGSPYGVFIYNFSYGFYLYACFQRPPIYDCNLHAIMGITQGSVIYAVPRKPNRRCLILAALDDDFDGVVVVTMNVLSLESDDILSLNRYGVYTSKVYWPTNPMSKDMVSEQRFFLLELYTSLAASLKPGINVTMTPRFATEFVYDYYTKGANYIGTKNFTEYNRPCLPWKYASSCYAYPATAMDLVLDFDTNNYCRNFGGSYKQPWCYVYINGSNCVKEYCDVNEFQQWQDRPSTASCAGHIATKPDFCRNEHNKLSCAKSCNYTTSILEKCPPDHYPAGPRCIFIPSGTYNRTGAEAVCAGKGPYSGLFQIFSKSDNQFLRIIRYLIARNLHWWVSGKQGDGTSDLYYDGTTTKLIYLNLSKDIDVSSVTNGGAALLSETTTPERQGSTWVFPTNNPDFRLGVVCQILRNPVACGQYDPPADGFVNQTRKPFYYEGDRLTVYCKTNSNLPPVSTICRNGVWDVIQSACADGKGADKYPSCQETLARRPRFCQFPGAASICPLSCGANGVTAMCTAPSSNTYVRTSPSSTVSNGQFLTFACASGYFLIGGDTERACGVNGSLLGQPPECVINPGELTIGWDLLLQRPTYALVNYVCLFDRKGYEVPIEGNLTGIYCMAISSPTVTVVVYRYLVDGANLAYVGFAQVYCEPGMTWFAPIPVNQQIQVKVGDLVGVYATVANTLYQTQCDGLKENLWNVSCAYVSDQTQLAKATFNYTKCLRTSMTYKVVSSTSVATNMVASKLVDGETTSTTRSTSSSSPTTTTTTKATTTSTSPTTTTTSRTTTPTTTKRKGFLSLG